MDECDDERKQLIFNSLSQYRENIYYTRRERKMRYFVLFENIYILYCIVLYGEEDHVFGITVLRKKNVTYKKKL